MQRVPFIIICLALSLFAQDDTSSSQDTTQISDTAITTTADSLPAVVDSLVSSGSVDTIDSADTTDATLVDTIPALAEGATRLVVTSLVDSVIVELNGVQLGVTPLTVDTLSTGEYHFILKKKGFYGKKMGAKLIADSTTTLTVDLRAPGSVHISSTPDSATILINKKRVGLTPFDAYPLRPDTYDILLLKDGYINIDTTITVVNAGNDSLAITFISAMPLDTVVSDTLASLDVDVDQTNKRRKTGITIAAASLLAIFVSMIFIFETAGTK